MHPPLSRADVGILIDESDAAARRLHRRLPTAAVDLDDLRQDLLLDLICRLPGFDARRGPIGAFAGIVLRNQSSRIASRIRRHRRAQGGALLSLDAFAGSAGTPISMMLANTDGLAAWHGHDRVAEEDADLRHDVARALGALPPEARGLCAALGSCALRDLVGRDGVSRSALYRRVARLHLDLAMRGLGGRWDDFRTA